jgi:hypothetical protein
MTVVEFLRMRGSIRELSAGDIPAHGDRGSRLSVTKVRRLPVLNEEDSFVGLLSLSDIDRHADDECARGADNRYVRDAPGMRDRSLRNLPLCDLQADSVFCGV